MFYAKALGDRGRFCVRANHISDWLWGKHRPATSCKVPSQLPTLLDQGIECEAAIWIAGHAYRHSRTDLILPLNGLVLCSAYIGRKRDKNISGHSLLNCDVRAR